MLPLSPSLAMTGKRKSGRWPRGGSSSCNSPSVGRRATRLSARRKALEQGRGYGTPERKSQFLDHDGNRSPATTVWIACRAYENRRPRGPAMIGASSPETRSADEEGDQNDDRNRNAKKPEKDASHGACSIAGVRTRRPFGIIPLSRASTITTPRSSAGSGKYRLQMSWRQAEREGDAARNRLGDAALSPPKTHQVELPPCFTGLSSFLSWL